ncbi:543_t:CDS:2, partial [Gigaspora margarita]
AEAINGDIDLLIKGEAEKRLKNITERELIEETKPRNNDRLRAGDLNKD